MDSQPPPVNTDPGDTDQDLIEARRELAERYHQLADCWNVSPAQVERVIGLLVRRLPDYTSLHFVGEGGMGEVWKAESRELKRFVAIKVLPPEVGDGPEFAERFVREARVLAQMDDPRIVRILDFGEADGLYFLVMEYVPGNLRGYLRSPAFGARYPLPQDRTRYAVGLLCELCAAVGYAHDVGVIHRDLKPENILLTEQGRVKLTDFGLALLVGQTEASSRLTKTRQVMGTRMYMAPEQESDPQSADQRSDVYALGVILYELLTGELPRGQFEPPSAKVQDPRLDDIVHKALAQDPARRYASAGEMKADLDKVRETPYRTALVKDLARFYAWCVFPVALIISVALRKDVSSLWWLFLWIMFRPADGEMWTFPRLRKIAHWQAFVSCLGINLLGPLLGFERIQLAEGNWLVGVSIAFVWVVLCIVSGTIGYAIGTWRPGWVRWGWLAFSTGVLLATAFTVVVLEFRFVLELRWSPFVATAVVSALLSFPEYLSWAKGRTSS